MSGSRIYTVSPGRPFLEALASAILAGDLPTAGGVAPTPISLASYTLLLPTRRATRALQDAFLAVSGGAALLLPKIRPIAEGQEESEPAGGRRRPRRAWPRRRRHRRPRSAKSSAVSC